MDYKDIDREQYTPMMQQYLDIKKDYLDTIVFFRLGDFYEMFFNDAIVASKELEIALTGKDAGAKERVPMCGIPHHAATLYIERLIEKGYKIAIVEQVEDPKEAKGIVKRDVVKLITPGTIIEDGSIKENENNYLVAVKEARGFFILAYSDFSTGENYITTIPYDLDYLVSELNSLKTKEIIVSSSFDKKTIERLQKNYYILVSFCDESKIPSYLEGLVSDIDNKEMIETFGMLLNYILKTQKRELMHLQKLAIYQSSQFLRIDVHSKRNLEIFTTLRNNQKMGSLLWLIDHCNTAMGSRELHKWLERPLLNKKDIVDRQDIIEDIMKNYLIKEDIKENLKNVYDLERIVGRISYGNANAKDLVQLRHSLENIPKLKELVLSLSSNVAQELGQKINPLRDLYDLLMKAVVDNPPLTIKEGGIIKDGFNEELDNIRIAKHNGKNWIIDLEQKEKERTGIKNLKIGYNRVFGYYIEISKGNLDLLPEDSSYERKQTLANAERFVTKELKEQEALILGADDKIIKLEYEIFLSLRDFVSEKISDLQALAKIISQIDVYCSLADVSEKNGYVRPIITDGRDINIVNGRHPVIEKVMDKTFVANDVVVNKYNTLLITGPNMSGKSTYMRMLAVIAIMTQIGMFVPADYALMPIFDQIFTRIGASDDLVSGQSTFMVEMLEANNAISNATKNSLILFDEIGRGTATYDGMALAQAIIEYVHEKIGCTTLFSTHYHELIQLENTLKRLKNVHVTAKEENKGVVFLHKVLDGPTDKSYGINVAQLAHLPRALIERSKQILEHLQANNKQTVELDLFNFDDYEEKKEEEINPIIKEISSLDVDSLSPIQALNYLYELKKKISN